MRYTLVANAANPIDLATAKEWLKITHNYEDTLVTSISESALSFCEGYTGCSFRQQDWSLSASVAELATGILITKSPLTAFDAVTVELEDDTTATIDSDDYYLTVDETRAYLVVTDPDVLQDAKNTFNAVTITFSTDAGMPAHIQNAVKMIISFMYENRGDAPTINNNSAPPEALKLLQLERVMFV